MQAPRPCSDACKSRSASSSASCSQRSDWSAVGASSIIFDMPSLLPGRHEDSLHERAVHCLQDAVAHFLQHTGCFGRSRCANLESSGMGLALNFRAATVIPAVHHPLPWCRSPLCSDQLHLLHLMRLPKAPAEAAPQSGVSDRTVFWVGPWELTSYMFTLGGLLRLLVQRGRLRKGRSAFSDCVTIRV